MIKNLECCNVNSVIDNIRLIDRGEQLLLSLLIIVLPYKQGWQ